MKRRELALQLFLRLPPERIEELVMQSGSDDTKIAMDQCWDAAFDVLDALDESEAKLASTNGEAIRATNGKWLPAERTRRPRKPKKAPKKFDAVSLDKLHL